MTRTITTLPEQLDALGDEQRARFDALFDVAAVTGHLDPPAQMHDWLTERFGSVDAVRAQRIVKVLNRWTREGSLFNGLRAQRPLPPPSASLPAARDGCDFCDPEHRTTADTFGRIRGERSISASNVAKYDGQHGVIIFEQHDALAWSEQDVVDAFATARRWLAGANDETPDAVYPFVLWNHGPSSGASIPHPHLQVLLAREPYARVGVWREAAAAYHRQTGRGLVEDLITVHDDLGLAGGGGARWLAHLTPAKERETMVIGRALDDDLARAIHSVLRALIDDLGTSTFNVAVYLRPLAPTREDWSELPAIARIVDRGDPARATSDIGAMELYAQPVISSDPFTVAEALRARLG